LNHSEEKLRLSQANVAQSKIKFVERLNHIDTSREHEG